MDHCIVCEHPKIGHWGTGCHRSSFLRGDCSCTFLERDVDQEEAGSNHRLRLEDITIEAMQTLPRGTVRTFEDLFYGSGPAEQRRVRRRLEAEFNRMPPLRRRQLLEASDVREFLENVGVVSRWSLGPVEHP
jgi:hypothetical protein